MLMMMIMWRNQERTARIAATDSRNDLVLILLTAISTTIKLELYLCSSCLFMDGGREKIEIEGRHSSIQLN